MKIWNKIRSRLGRGHEADLAEEMRLHRAELEQRYRAEGLSERDAHDRAIREFGPSLAAFEDSRAQWSFAWLESVWMDARYAVRALSRSKAYAATAVFTLAIGLAICSVAFTLFNAYVLRPFAVTDPSSLYEVHWRGKDLYVTRYSWADYEEIRARREIFSDVIASRNVTAAEPGRHWAGTVVTGNYFRMLGARMALGRPIEQEDARTPGGDNVIVLHYDAWKRVFDLQPDVLGRKLALRGHTYVVIGVAGQEFAGLEESPPDFWAPISMHSAFRTDPVRIGVVGRLQPGVSKTHAEAALAPIAQRIRPDARADLHSRATVAAFTPLMIIVFSPLIFALGLVLATCCANIANMMLARGLARQREIGVRLSIGAGRVRLVRQLLTEALAIAGLAGLVALSLSRMALEGGQRLFFATISPELVKMIRLHSLELDYRVFLFALGAAALAAVGAALMPALQSTRMDLVSALRGEFGGIRSSRLRDGLVVMQVIVCAVLLVCGALLYRRAGVFQMLDTGIQHSGVIDITIGDGRGEVAEYLRTQPDIEAVAAASRAPGYGRLDRTVMNATVTGFNMVSPEYFRVLGIALQSGRLFTEEEARTEAPVAIVSAATARAFWPGEAPIGKILLPEASQERAMVDLVGYTQIRVVGVAEDVNHGWVFEGRDRTCVYLPVSDAGKRVQGLLVRARGDESLALSGLRRQLTSRWPTLDVATMPLSEVMALQIYPFRAASWLGWILGLVAMGLSVSGMYGVMSYLVNQRSKEIGIRVALGAGPTSVLALVMRRSVWLAGWGVVIGGAFAAGAVKLLLWWSSSVSILAWDNVSLLSGAGLAGLAAVLAALGPSRRATRVDPNVVLRTD